MTKKNTTELAKVFLMVADPTLTSLYKAELPQKNYSISFYTPGSDWKALLRSSHFDIILLDFAIFSEKPIENLQEIQRLSAVSEIILLAEQEEAPTIIAAFKSGIADFYLKPTPVETLNWAIEKTLTRRSLSAKTSGLTADMEVFNTIQHIHIAESDAKMRELATQYLLQELDAAGAIWVWGDASPLPPLPLSRKTPYRIEPIYCETAFAHEQIEIFLTQSPGHFEKSYKNGTNTDPARWPLQNFLWIPSSQEALGGILVFGMTQEFSGKSKTRTEFLFRNLEVALEHYQRYRETKEQTYLDDLTGLYNSRFLELTLSTLVSQTENSKNPFYLLFIDIDHFKSINDKHGHVIGSQMLTQIAKSIKSLLRKSDQVFRYGGDEFIVILKHVAEEDALRVARRLCSQTQTRVFLVQTQELKATLSIGVARVIAGDDPKNILQMADDALYESKKKGRNQAFLAGEISFKKTGSE